MTNQSENSEGLKQSTSQDPSITATSPLWMVSQEPILNEFVLYLDKLRIDLVGEPSKKHEMIFSREHLRKIRTAFDKMIRRGEEGLHRLCEVFCHSFFGTYQLQSLVIGEVRSREERFTLTQILSPQDLYSTIDLDLGNRQLQKLQYFDGSAWVSPSLVANMVEYQPTEPNKHGVYKIISRIKAEEELWNKVVDEIFGLDSLVTRDKELRHLSRYVKDVFGIKIVVGTVADVLKLQSTIEKMHWSRETLQARGIEACDNATRLEFIEVKNYIRDHEKGSGWEAVKSVVNWHGRMFEIQIQPLKNFWRERETLTRESHSGFKNRREQVRLQVAEHLPLFGFYQDLLRWLVQNPEGVVPTYPQVSVVVTD